MMKKLMIILCGLLWCSIALAAAAPSQKQAITGSSAFSSKAKPTLYTIRIGVNPGSIARGETDIGKILQKITVVICAEGTCKFAKVLPGLGFYAAEFSIKQNKVKEIQTLVIACSKLGCVKKALKTKVMGA